MSGSSCSFLLPSHWLSISRELLSALCSLFASLTATHLRCEHPQDMKGYFTLVPLLLEMALTRTNDAAAIQSNPLVPEERLIDSSKEELTCLPSGVLFKTKGGLEICVDPQEMWIQKALDLLKKQFQQS
ncbi:C-C motif chemokine 18-like [Heptranchias perlo]|uniref:C-C motif chemokine 18-like n=1 Tax=Heptranchias perlo TaxID=212740 RepID=UPI00355AA767